MASGTIPAMTKLIFNKVNHNSVKKTYTFNSDLYNSTYIIKLIFVIYLYNSKLNGQFLDVFIKYCYYTHSIIYMCVGEVIKKGNLLLKTTLMYVISY